MQYPNEQATTSTRSIAQLPQLADPTRSATADEVRQLRAFHVGLTGRGLPSDHRLLPALLWPYRNAKHVRGSYPLVVLPSQNDGLPHTISLSALLAERVPESARLLRDNMARLELAVRQRLESARPTDFDRVVQEAGATMVAELRLAPAHAEELRGAIDALRNTVAQGTTLIDHGGEVASVLLQVAAASRVAHARTWLERRLAHATAGIRGLLQLDAGKDESQRAPGALDVASGAVAGQWIDFGKLSQLVGDHRGTSRLSKERRARLERVLHELIAQREPLRAQLVGRISGQAVDESCLLVASDAPLQTAAEIFDRLARDYAALFAALRIAELELQGPHGAYDAERHDPWFATFDWHAFSRDELLALPPVLALERATRVDLPTVSRLLRSGRPLTLAVAVDPVDGAENPDTYRQELGFVGISQRQAQVWQTADVLPEHFLHAAGQLLAGTRTGLLVTATVEPNGTFAAQLQLGAALESRAHPLFGYDPDAGTGFADRFDFRDNPAPEADWPEGALRHGSGNGAEWTMPVAFTFGDYALLDRAQRSCFAPVPDDVEAEELLMPLAFYLALEPEEQAKHLPFIWAIEEAVQGTDDDVRLRRLVVNRALVLRCRDRLELWHTLQELSGAKSSHVARALARARAEAEAQLKEQAQQLDANHQRALERLRRASVHEAMEGLARSLLQLDVAAIGGALAEATPVAVAGSATVMSAASQDTATPMPAAPTAAPEVPPKAPAPVEEEAWIDEALCTSCNDCINRNPRLFVYTANKQARIGDISAGTYEDLVAAAERCPARCIHPGTPTNPQEPNLDQLIERAKKFR